MSTTRDATDAAALPPRLWRLLLHLAELGAWNAMTRVSTLEVAAKAGVSQQTASRHLIALENRGYIQRQLSPRGSQIMITEPGRRALEHTYRQLRQVIEGQPQSLRVTGIVVSGLGEGAYYMSMREYRDQFLTKLGFDPFPGTLNLRLPPGLLWVRRELEAAPAIIVEGFTSRGRTFGRVKCFPALINHAVEGTVTLINRTHHDTRVIEVIAPINLRKRLSLREGSPVHVTIFLRDPS